MKKLTERTEIAQAMNFGKYPIIKIDLADKDEYGIKGTIVKIDTGKGYYLQATIRAYDDTKYLTTSCFGTMLVDNLSYEDYIEMADYANAPTIKADQEILIFTFNSVKKEVYAPTIIKTGKRVATMCSTPLQLETLYVL